MTKEEAIKKLNKFKNIEILYTNQYTILKSDLGEVQEAVETVLNLMKSIDRQKTACEKALAEYMEWQKQELEQKDKMIDLMAEQIEALHNSLIDEFGIWTTGYCQRGEETTIEEIKRYFESKTKGGKN